MLHSAAKKEKKKRLNASLPRTPIWSSFDDDCLPGAKAMLTRCVCAGLCVCACVSIEMYP